MVLLFLGVGIGDSVAEMDRSKSALINAFPVVLAGGDFGESLLLHFDLMELVLEFQLGELVFDVGGQCLRIHWLVSCSNSKKALFPVWIVWEKKSWLDWSIVGGGPPAPLLGRFVRVYRFLRVVEIQSRFEDFPNIASLPVDDGCGWVSAVSIDQNGTSFSGCLGKLLKRVDAFTLAVHGFMRR
jgi:hypothetical protein